MDFLLQFIKNRSGRIQSLVFVILYFSIALHLEHGRTVAGCQAFDFFDGKQAIGCGFADADA
jgi:hypothetical protein